MAWYAYCIGEKQAFPELARHRKPVPMESVVGVSGNQVFLYPASDLAIVVSEHNPAETLNQKSGVDHARVIADCFQHSTVLPFRFGTVFNDDEACANRSGPTSGSSGQHRKAARQDRDAPEDLRRRLLHAGTRAARFVGGRGPRVPEQPARNAARTRERQTRARAVSFQMHRLFMPLDEEVSCRLTESGKMVLDIAHLIEANTWSGTRTSSLRRAHDARVPDADIRAVAALPLRSAANAGSACSAQPAAAAAQTFHTDDIHAGEHAGRYSGNGLTWRSNLQIEKAPPAAAGSFFLLC